MTNDERAEQPQPEFAASEGATPQTEGSVPLEQKVEEERSKAERYLANWQRAQADFINYKRRVEGEREEVGRLATAALIINLLPLVDDLERALGSVDATLAGLTWIDGIRIIHRKFQAILEAAGVSEIRAEGENFDPNVHEAVMYADGDDGKVIRELQRGYKLGDRIVRPSMVVVGKRGGDGETKSEEGSQ